MKRSLTKKEIFMIVIMALLIFLIVAYLIFSRPMTIQQRYPMLSIEKCTEISGYYYDGTGVGLTEFSFDKNSEEFEALCDLLYERDYRRSLRDLLPQGTRTNRYQPGDFQWEVYFNFENIVFPNGSIGSGKMLSIQYWYGELDIHFEAGKLSCSTNKQEAWAKETLSIIQ